MKAGAGVALQGLVANPERLGALAQELAVSAHPLRIDGAHVEHLLGRLVFGVQLGGPLDPVLGGPAREHLLRRPKAGARVDHGRPADGTADGCRDRRAALGDRQAAVAVERGQRGEWLVGIGASIHVRARFQDHDLEPRLGEDRSRYGPAGAGADDRHVALLAARGRAQIAEARIGIGVRGIATDLAAHPVADRRLHPRVVAVAEAREDLEEEEQVRGARKARILETAEEVLARLEAGAAESPRKREPFHHAQGELDLPHAAPGHARQVAIDRLRDLHRVPAPRVRQPAGAGGRRKRPEARRHRLRERAKNSQLAGAQRGALDTAAR